MFGLAQTPCRALENVGKNFVNVLGQGGKGIAGGGKAVFGGVQGAFGTITSGIAGPKKPSTAQRPQRSRIPGPAWPPSFPSQRGCHC